MEKNQRYQKINRGFMVLYLLVCLWGIIDSFLHSTPYYMGLSLLSPPVFADSSAILEDHPAQTCVSDFSDDQFVQFFGFCDWNCLSRIRPLPLLR